MTRLRKAIIDYIPVGLQYRGGWFFVGLLCALSGLSFALGISSSNTINEVLDPAGLQVWGCALLLSGVMLMTSIVSNRLALEKLSLHILTICIAVYAGWLLTAVPFLQTGITIWLSMSLPILAQIRCAVIRRLIKHTSRFNEVGE